MSSGQEPDTGKQRARKSQALHHLFYCGFSVFNIRGPVTGQMYRFSRRQPEQTVDERDSAGILRTRLFRRIR